MARPTAPSVQASRPGLQAADHAKVRVFFPLQLSGLNRAAQNTQRTDPGVAHIREDHLARAARRHHLIVNQVRGGTRQHQALAVLANLSPAHFTALFKEQTGCSPRDYLHLLRIHRACQLLRSTTLNVKEIATRLGYQDQFHFSPQYP